MIFFVYASASIDTELGRSSKRLKGSFKSTNNGNNHNENNNNNNITIIKLIIM
jgi:hypothetical protein